MSIRVSVVMPVFNGERFLRKAIDSILVQTFSDFEFIIVDDGSTDGTGEIINSYRDPRIMLVRNEHRMGRGKARNRVIGLAIADYVAIQDADDVSLSTRLERQLAYMEANPRVGVLGTWIRLVDENESMISEWHTHERHEMIAWSNLFSTALAHPSIMYRRKIVVDAGGYLLDEAEDFDLWSRLAAETRFANLPEIFVLYRQHKNAGVVVLSSLVTERTEQILQRVNSSLLGRTVTLHEAGCLNKSLSGHALNSAADVLSTYSLIQQIMNAYLSKQDLGVSDVHWVRHDAARRLAILADANRHCFPEEAKKIMVQSIRMWRRLLRSRQALRVFLGINL